MDDGWWKMKREGVVVVSRMKEEERGGGGGDALLMGSAINVVIPRIAFGGSVQSRGCSVPSKVCLLLLC